MSDKPISRILLNRTKLPSASPTPDDLQSGELSLNYYDGKLFFKDASGSIEYFEKDREAEEESIDLVALYKSITEPIDVTVTAGGRKLYRHNSGMGTVIEFNDGVDRKVLVLDAQYRTTTSLTSDWSTDTSLPNYSEINNNGTIYIHGGSSTLDVSARSSVTDSLLNDLWSNSIDINTSKYNTNVWILRNKPLAATHCRSIMVNGVGCDIPNIQTLMRIWCESVLLDSMDPTVANYAEYSLANWFSGIFWAWTSSENTPTRMFAISISGKCNNDYSKDSRLGVIPTLEL